MVSLKLQKRLAASVLGCGKRRVWLDPNEVTEIAAANSRNAVRKLFQNGLVIRKPVKIHSRFRVRERNAAKALGRHTGFGKRKGSANARMPEKLLWVRRMRVLRRLLVKYRDQKKIDKHLYNDLYLKVKGNVYKNKRNLIEAIYKMKNENARVKAIEEQANAHRNKHKQARERRAKKQQERLQSQAQALAASDAAAPK
jgi:large subunit ribosomal protein L19e